MSASKKILNVFFREKPVKMLIDLKNAKQEIYASNLAKHIDCTYSHVVKILQEMERSGLIQFKKEGRLKLLRLTPKGAEIAENFETVYNKL
jgi:DNA-binding MarR family transcriptional regulator